MLMITKYFSIRINQNFSVDSVQYLGRYVRRDICDRNIESVIQDFWYKHNCMRANCNMLNSYALNKLHLTYCMNIYGSELLNYNSKYVNELYVAWRKAMRQLFNIDFLWKH